jgi:hypothetical protein
MIHRLEYVVIHRKYLSRSYVRRLVLHPDLLGDVPADKKLVHRHTKSHASLGLGQHRGTVAWLTVISLA